MPATCLSQLAVRTLRIVQAAPTKGFSADLFDGRCVVPRSAPSEMSAVESTACPARLYQVEIQGRKVMGGLRSRC